MKILFVCQSYYPEQFKITDIAETLVKEGHEVTVLTGLPNYPKGKIYPGYRWFKNRRQKINGVNIKRAWLIERGKSKVQLFMNYVSFCISASIKALLDKNEYDIVLCYQLSPITMAIPAAIIKARKKIPFILYCLDLWPESIMAGGIRKESFLYKGIKKLSKSIYEKADKIVVSSPKFADYFHNELEFSFHIDILYNYAEDIFKPLEYRPRDENKMNFLFAGNLGGMQSIETILKAAFILKDKEDIKFTIVGDGSDRERLEKLAEKYDLKNVEFLGYKPLQEMPDIYKKADAMLITLKMNEIISYTIPNKMQSYMAMGKPVIGAIDGGVYELIEKSECGFCTNAENSEGLAGLIMKFSDLNIEERKRIARNSINYYNDNFAKKIFMKRIQKFMREEIENV